MVNAAAAIQVADTEAYHGRGVCGGSALFERGVPNGFPISDLSTDVAANIDALNADFHVTSITLTDSGTPVLDAENCAGAFTHSAVRGGGTLVTYS